MQPPLFYVPPEHRDQELITLPGDEARHVTRVLRLKPGALIVVVDGLGNGWRAELASVTQRKVTARIHSEVREYGEPSVRLTLAAGLSTGYKFDSVVQRGTELGVSRFVPLLSEKSKVVIDEPKRARAKITRWTKVAVAAMKQCRRSLIPEISGQTKFEDFLSQIDEPDRGIIFNSGSGSVPLDSIELGSNLKRLTLLVGPESGFSDTEIAAAVEAGFLQVDLGRRVLRTETAGPTVVALVMARLGEFR